MHEPRHEAMKQSIIDGDLEAAARLARTAVLEGVDLLAVVERGYVAGIERVGELWEEGSYFLPELVQGAEAMKAAMAVLQPALGGGGASREPRARVVIGTVRGDLHDIGKSLVGTLLSAHGFEVHDLGSDVTVEAFVDRARQVQARIVAASALLTTTMTVQRELVRAIEAAALPSRPRVLIGGAPTTEAWAHEIGATHAENAMRAVAAAGALLA